MQTYKQENFENNIMNVRPPANLMGRIHMQILALLKYKPIKSGLNRPIASFSFDDVPKTAITKGAKILEAHNIKGTFYISGGHIGKVFENVPQYDAEDLNYLYKNGHEIACHSYSHPRLRGRSEEEINFDLNKNQEILREITKDNDLILYNHAFPYGEFDETTRAVLSKRFTSARGVLSGINHGIIDFSNLRTTSIEKQKFNVENIIATIEKAKQNNGWIIFFTHDIDENCTQYGSNPQMLETAIKLVKDAGVEIMKINDAANEIMAKKA